MPSHLPRPLPARHQLAAAVHLALVVSGAVLAVGISPATSAQEQRELRRYDIPAGPLTAALNRFAETAGIFLSGDATLTGARTSPGLQGEYGVADGLAALLRGTGLAAVALPDGGYTLREIPVANEGATMLEAVRVVAEQTALPTAIKVDQASVTRSGASILDTPQTVNVITRELAEQQDAQTLADVVRNVAGMQTSNYFGVYDSVASRGFFISNTGFLRDGFRFTNVTAMPRHHVARYEAFKGPASMDYGRMQPGGLINIVTKRPQVEPVGELSVGVGELDAYDISFDIGGALNERQNVLYRLDGGLMRQAFPSEVVAPEQSDVAGALSFLPGSRTRIDLSAETSHREQAFYPGLPVPEPMNAESADALPIGTFYGEGSAGSFEGEHRYLTARIEHRFNEDWALDAGYARNRTTRLGPYVQMSGLSADGLSANRRAFVGPLKYYNDTAQVQLKGRVALAGTLHRITLLADSSKYKAEYMLGGDGTIAPIDLYAPQQSGMVFDPLLPGGAVRTRDYGVSVQDYAELTRWLNLLLGARYSDYREINPDVPDQKGDNVDPTVGLVFKPRETISLYASLSRSSTPNAGTLVGPGAFAEPSDAEQVEVGGKAEWFDGALRTSVALYELTRTNVPTAGPDPRYSVLAGEVRSRGWELEVVGQPTARWSLMFNYARTDAEITRDNTAANVGKTLSYAPKNGGGLWSTYALGGVAQDWSIGGGVFHTGDRFVANNNLVTLPGSTIVDLMASRQFDARLRNARLQLNLRNVFNERYYDTGYSNAQGFTSVIPGLPRTWSLSLTVPLI